MDINIDVPTRLKNLTQFAHSRFGALEATGMFATLLGVGLGFALVKVFAVSSGLVFISAVVIAVMIGVAYYTFRKVWLRQIFANEFKSTEERLIAGRLLAANTDASEVGLTLRRAIGMVLGSCSCSQCGRSIRRLDVKPITCKHCKVELKIAGYPCPKCGLSGTVFTSREQVTKERALARRRQVRGPLDLVISVTGVDSVSYNLEAMSRSDVLRCSCGETWGVPLSRIGHKFPDGLPKLKA